MPLSSFLGCDKGNYRNETECSDSENDAKDVEEQKKHKLFPCTNESKSSSNSDAGDDSDEEWIVYGLEENPNGRAPEGENNPEDERPEEEDQERNNFEVSEAFHVWHDEILTV